MNVNRRVLVKKFAGNVLIWIRWVRRCRGARRCGSTAATNLGHYQFAPRSWPAALLVSAAFCPLCFGAKNPAGAHFRKQVQPILVQYCYDCHGDGMDKGKVAFDEFKSDEELLGKRDLWWEVLKNLRAGIMPPERKPHPSADERRRLETWIKQDVFGIDPKNPDPGRVTIRRLNRVEYRNTIRDLMGTDFRTDEEFPPDDTGYGFDNIGDVLTMSPLLLEKYMQAAESIVATAVPTAAKVVPEKTVAGREFRASEGSVNGEVLSFYNEAKVSHTVQVENAGDYRLFVELNVRGAFDFDPGKCRLIFKADDQELLNQEFIWNDNKKFHFQFDQKWNADEHKLTFELQPLTPPEEKKTSVDMRIGSVKIQGPLEQRYWTRTKNYDRFFFKDEPPGSPAERRSYAREVLRRFTKKAFRRPVDDKTLDRLVRIAEEAYGQPGKPFEDGVGRAMVAVLSSPRFLFRLEEIERAPAVKAYPSVDEYSLASRLSYFLWSTMPDEELFQLADRHELRKNLAAQVKRMLADARSNELVQNFTGQWLQVRDVEGININAQVVLARDSGEEKDLEKMRERFRELQAIPEEQLTPEQKREREQLAERRRQRFNRPAVELDGPLRRAMREETEMFFRALLREDRSVMELIDSDYTFLNERLARHYGIPEVSGSEMRRVVLPENSPRGGLLTQGSVLVVTSNPTRTSPVKRGLFVLDNILGMPPPPPLPDVPLLEQSEKEFKDHEPTLREVLELHRNKPLCSSCHNRMDPLGLALENFNALGMWREKERGQPIAPAGRLISGETFNGIRELKQILKEKHRRDFYACLTEKLLTYALGRGVEHNDAETVDRIVERLEKEDGRFSALLMGIVESAPFQKRRNAATIRTDTPNRSVEPAVQARLKQ